MATIERVVLHIGSDKAGSSAIQEAVYANIEWYRARGIHVIRTGLHRGAGHPSLFTKLAQSSTVETLAQEVAALPEDCHTVLLTWEGVHFFEAEDRDLLRGILRRYFPEAGLLFVYYVRNQVDLIQSGVLQQLKQLSIPTGTILDLHRPLAEIPAHNRQHLFNRKRLFNRRVAAWRRTFPDADFIVRLYDRRRLLNGDVIDDFHEAIGIETDEAFARPRASANASLTAEAAIVLHRFASLAWAQHDQRRAVDTLLPYGSIGGSGDYLHEDTRAAMAEHYRADNADLVAAYPACDGIDDIRSRPRPLITAEEIDACTHFLLGQSEFPTLLEGTVRRDQLDRLNLLCGWDQARDNGAWAIGPRSVLRFRPRGMHFGGYTEGVDVTLGGRYAGRLKQTDHVLVNGTDLGPVRLGEPFRIPVEALDQTVNIELTLEHQPARRFLAREEEQRTFLLQSLSYAVL
jgi:hypothetical protein